MRLLSLILLWLIAAFLLLVLYDSVLPPISTLMMARYVTGRPVARQWVPLAKLPPALPRAIIAAEDAKFCTHHGVDWEALHKVVEAVDKEGDESHGASTLSMQVAKNLFLWPSHSYVRKGLEIPLALAIDAMWGKHRMMEVYVNVAEFGDGIYGVEAAAHHYFGKSASALDAHEAALLAAILPNPIKRSAAHPSAYVEGYAETIGARAPGVASTCLRR